MLVSFELTMPNVGSWNGKWTGAANKYYVVNRYFKKPPLPSYTSADVIIKLLDGKPSQSFYYNFGDGWGTNVKMEIVDSKEANKRNKITKGFCGYEWMIKSILSHGKIIVKKEPTPVNI